MPLEKVFSSLRILVSGVIASFVALFWSMVLLSIVMLIAALFLCQIVGESMEDPSADDDRKAWAYRFYGTSSRSTWTVFEFTFSGGWPTCARPLVEGFGAKYAVFFALYISAVTFAMFRIISALFLKDTLRAASLDFDTTIEEFGLALPLAHLMRVAHVRVCVCLCKCCFCVLRCLSTCVGSLASLGPCVSSVEPSTMCSGDPTGCADVIIPSTPWTSTTP